ncbi:uncharacterized protein LOC119090138, partial [Pollicipes pollicipes]|uniref:uncharacterized protein LOC119090138 n=1 Tax=Pollicipes pollicipes TaxID=41117 RepID=UPI0018858D19
HVEKAARKYLGASDSSVVTALTSYINAGYSKDKTTSKISSLIDASKAAKLTARVYDLLEEKRLGPKFAAKRPGAAPDATENGAKKMRREEAVILGGCSNRLFVKM